MVPVRRVSSLEDEVQHYRARFALERDGGCTDVLRAAQEVVYAWVERTRAHEGAADAEPALSDEGAFMAGTSCWPAQWQGSAQTSEPFAFATARFDAGGKTVWAMEMDKADSSRVRRRWHTRIGLFGDAGRVVVNIQITYRIEAGCFASTVPAPPSAPAVVRGLMGIEGAAALVGNMSLTDAMVPMRENVVVALGFLLLDPKRQMPIVLVGTDEEGRLPYCGDVDIARSLCGMAQVLVIDFSDQAVASECRSFFSTATPASWDYRINPGEVRIYLSGCDLASDMHTQPQWRFTAQRMERNRDRRQAESFLRIMAEGLARSIGRRDGDVLEISDVEWVESAAGTSRLQAHLSDLRGKVQALEEWSRANPPKDGEGFAALQESAATWQELAEELDAEVARLSESATQQAARASAAERKAAALEEALAQRELKEADCDPGQILEAVPQTLVDVLRYAEAVWPSRLAFTDASWKGADEWNDELGSLAEEYEIVKAAAEVLWPLHAEQSGGGDITRAFQERTGFELTLKEGKVTNSIRRFAVMRKCVLDGREYNATAHIKGRNGKLGFRFHYAWDEQRRQIVVGHVGAHLETDGTRRKSYNV